MPLDKRRRLDGVVLRDAEDAQTGLVKRVADPLHDGRHHIAGGAVVLVEEQECGRRRTAAAVERVCRARRVSQGERRSQ